MMTYLLKKTQLVTSKEKSNKLYKKLNIKSLLDLGAGNNPHFHIRKKLNIKSLLVDLFPWTEKENIVKVDVRDSESIEKYLIKFFGERQADCVVAPHLIEHFEKSESLLLLKQLEQYAKKLIIIETPNGFLKQDASPNNPLQEHLCGYTVQELRCRGYTVTGSTGLKILRNDFDKGSYRGNWVIFHALDRVFFKFLHFFPKLSFNLFAYKILQKS